MIYLLISIILDIFLSNVIISSYQNINYLFPIILISSFAIFYNIIKNKKVFFILIIVLGIIYDLLYSGIPMLNLYYFLLLGLFLHIFYLNKKPTYFNIVLISIFSFIFYDIYIAFILILLDYINIEVSFIIYKIASSFLINFLFVLLSTILLRSRILGYRKGF